MVARLALFVTALTDVDTSARDQIGAIRMEQNGDYKYVQFGATRTTNVTAALASGDIACYVVGTTADLDLMTLVDSANSAIGAGAVLATIPATGGPYYGWLKIRGRMTLDQTMSGSPAAGDMLTCAGAAAKLMAKRTAAAQTADATMVDVSTPAAPVVLLSFPN